MKKKCNDGKSRLTSVLFLSCSTEKQDWSLIIWYHSNAYILLMAVFVCVVNIEFEMETKFWGNLNKSLYNYNKRHNKNQEKEEMTKLCVCVSVCMSYINLTHKINEKPLCHGNVLIATLL